MRDWRYLNMRNIGRTDRPSGHGRQRLVLLIRRELAQLRTLSSGSGRGAAISSARERIGAEVELHDSGPVLLAAFDVENRPGGVGRPQRPSLPPGVRIVGAPFRPFGVKAHGIRNAQRDPLAVD